MMDGSVLLLIVIVSAGATVLLSRGLLHVAFRFGLMDKPDGRKPHRGGVPIGGPALVLGSVAGLIPLLGLAPTSLGVASPVELLPGGRWTWAGALGVAALGLWDDRRELPPRIKLAGQVVFALFPVFLGRLMVQSVELSGFEMGLGPLAGPLTVLWLVGITNAFNLIDGLDGLAAGAAVVLAAASVVASGAWGEGSALVPSLQILGAAAAFAYLNRHPARVFLGDSGSYFLGFLLAVTVTSSVGGAELEGVPLGILVLWFGYPLGDTLWAIVRRAWAGRSIFAADREHLHHRLCERTGSHVGTVWLLYALFFLLAGLGLLVLGFRGA